MEDLKAVYAAPDEAFALAAFEDFSAKWDKKYPKISQSWQANRPNLSTYFKFPAELRKLIYTTNAIEGFNCQLRKVTESKSVFPTDGSLFKMLYLAMIDMPKNEQADGRIGVRSMLNWRYTIPTVYPSSTSRPASQWAR